MIETTVLDGVTLVRLNRPPVNALDIDLNQGIASTFGSLVGPIVLTGTGRCFSAGVDLRAILNGAPDYTDRFLESLVDGFLAVFDYPGPVVAAVNGHALAGGCVLAMAADIRYMSAGTIGVTEIAVGVPFPTAAIEICRHVMGASATRAALGGESLTPEEALRLGWIDATVDPDELLDLATARARALGSFSADAYADTKRHLHRHSRNAIAVSADEGVSRSWRSDETRSRISTFLEQLAR